MLRTTFATFCRNLCERQKTIGPYLSRNETISKHATN